MGEVPLTVGNTVGTSTPLSVCYPVKLIADSKRCQVLALFRSSARSTDQKRAPPMQKVDRFVNFLNRVNL